MKSSDPNSYPGLPKACSRLSIADLQVVLAISESGGIRRASAELGIGQSAITRRLQKLEDVLGVSLFERSQSGSRLTVAGLDFSVRTRDMIGDLRVALASARHAGIGQNGRLRIGLIASLSRGALREVVTKFHFAHPDIEMSFAEADRNELMTLLSHRVLDIVFAAGGQGSRHCDTFLLTHEPLYLAIARSHPLAQKRSVRWCEVLDEPFVVSATEPGPEISDYILRRISDLGRRAMIHHHRLDREGIMSLVGLGLGLSLMCDHWLGVSYPGVSFVPLRENGRKEVIPFSLIWRPENDNPALRRFLSLAREVAKADAASSGPS